MGHGRIFVSQTSFGRPAMAASMGPTNELLEVDAAALVENFGATMKTLDAMLTAAPEQPGGLDLDEVEVALSIAAD